MHEQFEVGDLLKSLGESYFESGFVLHDGDFALLLGVECIPIPNKVYPDRSYTFLLLKYGRVDTLILRHFHIETLFEKIN